MAWYRIAENVLDAIADAINAKTGGTSPMTPVEMVTEIGTISGGGGMQWELIADYTSDEAAEIVMATIPNGKQDSNVYRYQFDSNGASLYYPYLYINNTKGNNYYVNNSSRIVHCISYVVKKPQDDSSEVAGTTPPTGLVGAAPYNIMSAVSPLVNLGMQAYAGHTVPAGFNIKIWRLVES